MRRDEARSLPKYASCFGMYSCISDNNLAISWESFVMLHSSSEWKSGLICLHSRSWLITLPKLLGPTADPSDDDDEEGRKRKFIQLFSTSSAVACWSKFVLCWPGSEISHITAYSSVCLWISVTSDFVSLTRWLGRLMFSQFRLFQRTMENLTNENLIFSLRIFYDENNHDIV